MRFALIDNKRIEAESGLKGLCPGCSQPVIAKCGTQRIHHWAHVTKKCDSWWEPETEWHRSWKSNFPVDWQEIVMRDELTGEKHIADVRTIHGIVVEFQHSHIDPKERVLREAYYKKMVWVVDGTRLKNDYKRLLKGKENISSTNSKGICTVSYPEECFPTAWLGSSVPVIFDFRGMEPITDIKDIRNTFFCLFPGRIGRDAILITLSHELIITNLLKGNNWATLMNNISQYQKAWQRQIELQERQQANLMFDRYSRAFRYQQTRRRGRF